MQNTCFLPRIQLVPIQNIPITLSTSGTILVQDPPPLVLPIPIPLQQVNQEQKKPKTIYEQLISEMEFGPIPKVSYLKPITSRTENTEQAILNTLPVIGFPLF